MKFNKINLLCIALLCLSLILVSCGSNSQPESHPLHYKQLVKMEGENKEAVLEKLSINEDDLELQAIGLYETPIEVDYSGYSFLLLLEFDESSGEFYGFWYRQKYLNDVEKAEKVIETLYENLENQYGTPDKDGDISNSLNNKSALGENFINGEVYSTAEIWNISDEVDLYLEVSSDGNSNVAVQMKYKFNVE